LEQKRREGKLKRIHLDITSNGDEPKEDTRDEALSSLKGVESIDKVEGRVGLFGKAVTRNFFAERIFDRGRKIK
jgi:hypothetical protein